MKLRKLFAAGLALVMTLAMAAPAFAAETKNSITVTNVKAGETYKAYKLFDATQSDDEKNISYTIAADSAWKSVLENYKYDLDNDGAEDTVFTFETIASDTTKLTVKYGAGVDAAHLAAYLAKNIPATAAAQEVTATEAGATFTGLELGYYFVTTTTGSLCALDTNNSKVVIEDKNSYPTVEKSADKTNASMGETITYTLKVNIPASADKAIKLVDTLDAGLTLVKAPESKANEYTVSVDGQKITIDFDAAYVKGLTAGTTVTLTYTAYINTASGVVSTGTNDNTVELTYSAYKQTAEAKVSTYMATFLKVNGEDKPLSDVTFKLTDKNDVEIEVVKVENADGSSAYRVADAATKAAADYKADTITTDANGEIKIEGLGSEQYKLVELSTQTGYNLLKEPVSFQINKANDLYANNEGSENDHNVIVNNTGIELPTTGGMGTTLFYIVGGLMVVCAGVVLVTKKRMGNK